jgi:hypothetical protein
MNPRNALTPTERIHALEAALSESLSTLSTLEVERDVLRSLLLPDSEESPTLKIGQRFGVLPPTTGIGAQATVGRLTRIGDILQKRDRK